MSRARPEPIPGSPLTVVCAGFDWQHPSPLRHLELALAREHRVIHLESLGLRRPRPGVHDAARTLWKAARIAGIAPHRGPEAPVTVLAPRALPLPASPVARVVNGWALARSVRRALDDRPVDLFLTALPTALELMIRLRAPTSVYYRVDDWPRWPGVDGQVVAELERGLMDRVDLTFATSRALLSGARSLLGGGIHLPQGVDLEHFGRALHPGPALPSLRALPGPVLGAFGRWDDRVDWPLLEAVARTWPGTVVLAGPAEAGARSRLSAPPLRWLGPLPYAELPRLARGVDVWLLPYVVGPRTDAIDPLKLREYLATGRPVVATPMPELAPWRDYVRLASTPGEMVSAALEYAADAVAGREDRLGALAGEGWDDRCRVFLEHVAHASGRTGRAGAAEAPVDR